MIKTFASIFIFFLSLSLISDYRVEFSYESFVEDFKNIVNEKDSKVFIVSKEFTDKDLLKLLNNDNPKNLIILVGKNSLTKKYSLKDTLSKISDTLLFYDDSLFEMTMIFNDSKKIIISNRPLYTKKYLKNLFYIRMDDTLTFQKIKNIYNTIRKNSISIDSINDTLNFELIKKNLNLYENRFVNLMGTVKDVYKSKKSETYFIKLKGYENFSIVAFQKVVKEFKNKNINPLYFKNKKIIVSGFLTRHIKYGYQIILEDTKNIRLVK